MSFNLRDVDGTTGFFLTGTSFDDRLGRTLASPGDINGDGVDDLAIGGRGIYYLITGSATVGAFIPEISLEILDNPARDSNGLGSSIAPLGDVDGDGADEFAVGRPGLSNSAVVFGSVDVIAADVVGIDAPLVNTEGTVTIGGLGEIDAEGLTIMGLGDVNGDGVLDYALALPNADATLGSEKKGTLETRADAGLVFVLYGDELKQGEGEAILLSDLKKKQGFLLQGATGDGLGAQVSQAGDINGDGFGDLLVATGTDDADVFLILGAKKGPKNGLDLSQPQDGVIRLTYNGAAIPGAVISDAGDVNQDGLADIMIGLPDRTVDGKINAGQVIVLYGSTAYEEDTAPAEIDLATLSDDDGAVLTGAAGDRLGASLAAPGDLNDDGFDDLLIQAAGRETVALVFGGTGGLPDTDDLLALDAGRVLDLTIPDMGADLGAVMAAAGDLNGDGFDDAAIAAPLTDTVVDTDAGTVFGLFGSETLGGLNDLPVPVDDDVRLSTASAGVNVFDDNGAGEDRDPDLDALSVVAVEDVTFTGSGSAFLADSGITVSIAQTGLFSARLSNVVPLGDVREDSFTYTVEDERGGQASATVNVSARQATITLDGISAGLAATIEGASAGDALGQALAAIGDINGDTFMDYAISAANADEVAVIFGTAQGLPDSIDLDTLDGTDGFIFGGAGAGVDLGEDLAAIGDVNDDGIDDLLIAAPRTGASGTAYVIFGAEGFDSELTPADLSGGEGLVLNSGPAEDTAGMTVASADDFNNDGVPDFLVSIPAVEDLLFTEPGRVTVIFGQADPYPDSLSLAAPGAFGVTISGTTNNENAGSAADSIGDVNGDGIDDILVAIGDGDQQAAVIYGSDTPGNMSVEGGGARFVTVNEEPVTDVAGIGDINNDGIADFALGVGGADGEGVDEGLIYVLFGRDEDFEGLIDLEDLTAEDGFFIGGAPAGALVGFDVGAAGDVNNDGIDDLLIGAPGLDGLGTDRGAAYVVFGRSEGYPLALDLGALSGLDGYVITGGSDDGFAGFAVAAAGDTNDDGIDDLLIGVPGSNAGGADRGQVFAVYGQETPETDPIAVDDVFFADPDEIIELTFIDNDEEFNIDDSIMPFSVTPTDVQGDFTIVDDRLFYSGNGRLNDLPFGQTMTELFTYIIEDETGRTDTGTISVVITRDPVLTPIVPEAVPGINSFGTSVKDRTTLTEVSDLYSAEGGDDKVKAKRGDDYLYGGSGNDQLFGEKGNDVMYGGTGNDVLTDKDGNNFYSGDAGDDRIRSGKGNDIIIGGAGNDLITEIDGADIFIFEPGWGDDEIKGFDPEFDTLVFTDPALDSFDDLQVTEGARPKDTLIRFGDDKILLDKTDVAEITADNFRFDFTIDELPI